MFRGHHRQATPILSIPRFLTGLRDSMHRRWINLAFKKALSSPHPKVQVGAVIIAPDGKTILAATHNGFADGVKNQPARLRDGEKSFWIMCAEKRALNSARKNLKKHGLTTLAGCKLYSTLDPCHTCADDLICAGIKGVYVPDAAHQHHPKLKAKWRKSIMVGAAKLRETKIKVTKLSYGFVHTIPAAKKPKRKT
jgi:dCMP deaminase